MIDPLGFLRPWVIFAGTVLVVLTLYGARVVLVPIAVATLLTFLLAPLATAFQRRLGRVAGVLIVACITLGSLGGIAWAVGRQLAVLVEDLPAYRQTIRQKARDIQGAQRGGSLERLQDTVRDIETELAREERPRGTPAQPVVIAPQPSTTLWGFSTYMSPLVSALSTGGLAAVLVIFMLLERQELRNRFVELLGSGHLVTTTKAFDEAGARISRYLQMQTTVNALFGTGVAAGLWAIDLPQPLLWAVLAATLRFIPYVGPILGALGPILISAAALPGWAPVVMVTVLFIVLELVTNLVLETWLFADAAGVSQVALLVAVAFWTWIWGPVGLFMATPLTVCLVVIGKHVPALRFLATLMADRPELSASANYYQRLLARDPSEAAEILERHVKTLPPETVYDEVLVPALVYAERDRAEGRLEPDEEHAVVTLTRELLADTAWWMAPASTRTEAEADPHDGHPTGAPTSSAGQSPSPRTLVLGCAVGGIGDELALQMLRELLRDSQAEVELLSDRLMASELVAEVVARNPAALVLADLPPSNASKSRYLVKKLRARLPVLPLIVGRWCPPSMQDDEPARLQEAGAMVSTTLLHTRDTLLGRAFARPMGAASATDAA